MARLSARGSRLPKRSGGQGLPQAVAVLRFWRPLKNPLFLSLRATLDLIGGSVAIPQFAGWQSIFTTRLLRRLRSSSRQSGNILAALNTFSAIFNLRDGYQN